MIVLLTAVLISSTVLAERIETDTQPHVIDRGFVRVQYTNFPEETRAAFQHAVDRWAELVEFTAPFVIDAGYYPDQDEILEFEVALACLDAYASCMPSALANNLEGRNVSPHDFDLRIDLYGLPDWYLGLDGNPPEKQVDMVTIIMHVIGHGLGILSGAESAGEGSVALDRIDGQPYLYDRGLWTEDHGLLTELPSPSETLHDAVTQESLLWGDVEWDNVHGEKMRSPSVHTGPVPLLSWTPYDPLLHVLHLDPYYFPDFTDEALMASYFFYQGKSHHSIGPVTLAMLHDMGWTLTDSGEDAIENRREFYPIEGPRRVHASLRERDGWVHRVIVMWSVPVHGDPRLMPDHWEVRGSSDWPNQPMSGWHRTDESTFEFSNFTDFGTTYRWEVRAVGTSGQRSAPPYPSAELFIPESSRRPAPPGNVRVTYYKKGDFFDSKDIVYVNWSRLVLGPTDPRRTEYWEVRYSSDWPNKGMSEWAQRDEIGIIFSDLPVRGTTYRWEVRSVGPTGLRSAPPHKSDEVFVPEQ